MNSRLAVVVVVVFAGWVALVVRTAYLQIFPNSRLEMLKERQFQRSLTLRPQRGQILDRNGKELAVSIDAASLFADPKLIRNPIRVAGRLAKLLKISKDELVTKLRQNQKRFVWIQRRLDLPTVTEIKNWNIRGLGFVKEPKRVYPNGNMLAQVLGSVGDNGKGLEGLEFQYDELLAGQEIQVRVQRDARGRPLIHESQLLEQKVYATDIQLTIDAEIQYVLERELSFAVEKLNAQSGVGVVLDAKTSEVLAMASVPTYDANAPFQVSMENRRNRALTDFFEPGSTMKTFLVAGALSTKRIHPNSRYFCENGRMKVGRHWIRESDARHKWGDLSVGEILAVSSNVCSAKIGFDLAESNLRGTLVNFGFGQKTGVAFPGESSGILKELPWRRHLLSNIAIGHGLATTPIQIAQAYAAIANGGELVRPRLIKLFRNSVTGDPTEFRTLERKRVMDRNLAEKLSLMLTAATSPQGTGENARVNGFPVAGKTGTAQKVNPNGRGYMPGRYISSFAGFLPAHDPKFVIYIAVDDPQKRYYGAQVAAPIFSKVAGFAVRKSGLAPVLIGRENLLPARTPEIDAQNDTGKIRMFRKDLSNGFVPQVEALSLREILDEFRRAKVQIQVEGTGSHVKILPPPGEPLTDQLKLRLILSKSGGSGTSL